MNQLDALIASTGDSLAAAAALAARILEEKQRASQKPPPTQTDSPTFTPSEPYMLPRLEPKRDIFASVVAGENHRRFAQLEVVCNTMRTRGITKNLLLVGPASCGKTMTAQIVSAAIERPCIPMSGMSAAGFISFWDKTVATIHGGNLFSEARIHPENGLPVYRVKPTTVFVDEAHALPKDWQDALLEATEGYRAIFIQASSSYYDFQDVLWILGTTNPTGEHGSSVGLSGALISRFTPVHFNHYSAETIATIVQRRFPHATSEAALLAARASKLRPRVALGYLDDCGDYDPIDYLRNILGFDADGLDENDHNLLQAVYSSVTQPSNGAVVEAKRILEAHARKEKVTPAQVAKAERLLTPNYKPIGVEALASRVRSQDIPGIRDTMRYLEILGKVTQTGRGYVPANANHVNPAIPGDTR